MSDSEAEYARRTERIKNLLSSYYGNAGGDQGPGGGSAAAAAGAAAGPSDLSGAAAAGRAPGVTLDSPAFNPEHHIAQMIKTYSIDRLMAEHRGMAREIKNLDSDMQQLVYENYNKFIAATDTIRAMKTNVDGMETDMDQLKTNMDTVAEKSRAVNQKLLKRREHIEELNRVQQLLAKLQAVFELPNRMKAALEEDALDSAVSFYAEALPLLRKYGHKGAFRGIAAEADAAAKQISAALKRRLAERKDDTEQVVLLLRKLGEGDDTLQEKYLQGRSERMHRILQEASLVADALAAAAGQQAPAGASSGSPAAPGAAAVDNPESWGFSPAGTPPSLSRFIKALDERLINAMQETVMNVSNIFLQGDRAAARRKPLVGMAKDMIGAYFKLVRRVVGDAAAAAVAEAACLQAADAEPSFSSTAPSLSFSDNWGVDTVVQAMSAVTTDIGLLHSQLPELSLRDWAAAATEQAVRGHISAAFGALEGRIHAGVRKAYALLAKSGADVQVQVLAPAYNHLSEAIQRGTAALLKGLRAYEHHGKLLASLQEQLSDAVQRQLQAMFQSLVGIFLSYGKIRDTGSTYSSQGGAEDSGSSGGGSKGTGSTTAEPPDEPPKTGLVLLLAKLCSFMESSVVPGVLELLASGFQGRGGFRASDQPPPFVGGEVARRLGTAANLLLACYVDLHGCSLSLLVQRSVCSMNWLAAAPPRAPRPVCDLLLGRLARAEAEVAALIDTSGRTTGAAASSLAPHHHQRGASMSDVLESGAVERGVAKLFRGKAQPFGSGGLRFSQSAVLAAVIIVGLKSLLEYIRLQTLGKAGLQQLQLDMFYLRPKLLQLVGGTDAEAVAQLLDEVVAAGAERSTEPVMLEQATLEKALLAASRE